MINQLLSIDDTNLHLSIIAKIATQVGFQATGAGSVSEAVKQLRTRSFDCITLDLSLGERSGTEILIVLAELKTRTPIILISGSEDQACEEAYSFGRYLDLNLCQPIRKPIDLARLRAALKQIARNSMWQRLKTSVGA